MRKINLLILILLLLLATLVLAAKIVPMPDIVKADIIKVDGHDLVIAQGPAISIYSLKDFKLIKKFGKEGEGPFFVPGLPGYNDPLHLCHRWGETISIG